MRTASLIVSCILMGMMLGQAQSAISGCSSTAYDQFRMEYCLQCYTGYYLSSGRCYSCPSGCYSCSSSSYCNSCKSTYYLTNTNTCYSCSTGCATCQDAFTCTQCSSSYYLSGTSCSRTSPIRRSAMPLMALMSARRLLAPSSCGSS